MKDKKELEVGILYLCIYTKLCERINNSRIYPKIKLNRMLGETFHVPKRVRACVLKEMETKGLIKDLGNKRNSNIFVERVDFNLEEDANKFFEWLGIIKENDNEE